MTAQGPGDINDLVTVLSDLDDVVTVTAGDLDRE
jgi:hypothetical protein